MNKDNEPWRSEIQAMDVEVLAVQQMAAHGFWPSIALACAMIDKGLLEKKSLLEFVDALISYVSAFSYGDLGDVDDRLHPLEHFRGILEHTDLRPGRVLAELQTLESVAALRMLEMSKRERRSRGTDEEG